MSTSEDTATLGTVEYMGPWGGFSDRDDLDPEVLAMLKMPENTE